jgi:hypothetical protein
MLIDRTGPILFLDNLDEEFSVLTSDGQVYSDLSAADHQDPAVRALGERAIRLNRSGL